MRIIDLHCHTLATKKGDPPTRNVSSSVFAEKLEEAGVQIVAVTNHNLFDLTQYEELSKAADQIAQVWPGVELDVNRDDEHWHMIVVCDRDVTCEFNKTLANLIGERGPDDCQLEFSDVWSAFLPLNALFISHADKQPGISEKGIAAIVDYAGDEKWRLFFEPSSLMSVGIMANHGFNTVIGSDVKDWREYEKCNFGTLRLDVDGFKQLCLLARRDEAVVKTLLDSRGPKDMKASPHEGIWITLPIYQDINIIFGQKGTGKSQIIASLINQYKELGTHYSSYIGGKKQEDYAGFFTTSNMDRKASVFGRSSCEDEIAQIISWEDVLPTQLDSYTQWFDTKDNSKKKQKFKLSESQSLAPIMRDSFEQTTTYETEVNSFANSYDDYGLSSYLPKEESDEFGLLLGKLGLAITNARRIEFIDIESTVLANESLDAIKDLIDKKSETVSKPSCCGLLQFVMKRVELYKLVSGVLRNLAPCEKKDDQYLGTLEDKGKLFIVERWRYHTQDSRADEYTPDGISIRNLAKWKNSLIQIKESIFKSSLSSVLDSFAEIVRDTGITSLDSFIGMSKYSTLGHNGNEYNPSDGEKGMLLLEHRLHQDADVYILDEPELGMSNLYMDSVVRPILVGLARKRKTVIVATHNANLAVRTLPYQSIYREHVNGQIYKTYLGNPFTNALKDIDHEAPDLEWSKYCMETLEGGPDAFYSRQSIYEAGGSNGLSHDSD
ncbi:MAG: hypothetical protein PHR15_05600 [Atopobiaceae bacterium]|nr:hypothetical protein [Atopobiaceae bacterium]